MTAHLAVPGSRGLFALEHAGVSADEVDEIVLGHFNAGFSRQDFTASFGATGQPRAASQCTR